MVTTIKITCDGVFIQSNSYLTPTTSRNAVAHHRMHANNIAQHLPTSSTLQATSTTATSFAICSDDPSNSDTSSNECERTLRQSFRHTNSTKVALISATISSCNNKNNSTAFNSYSSNTSSSSSHSSCNSHTSHTSHLHATQRQRRQRRSNSSSPRESFKFITPAAAMSISQGKAVESRRRYYYSGSGAIVGGNSNIYWCKQALFGSGHGKSSIGSCKHPISTQPNRRAHTAARVMLSRSASSITPHKEFRKASPSTTVATVTGVGKMVAVRRESTEQQSDGDNSGNQKSNKNGNGDILLAVAACEKAHTDFCYSANKQPINSNNNEDADVNGDDGGDTPVKVVAGQGDNNNKINQKNKVASRRLCTTKVNSPSSSISACNSSHNLNVSTKRVSPDGSVSSDDTTRLFNFLRAARKIYQSTANNDLVDGSQNSADKVDKNAQQQQPEPTKRCSSSLEAINNRLEIADCNKSSAHALGQITVSLNDDWFG